MMIGRVLTAAVAVATLAGASPALIAQQNNQDQQRSQQEQRDIQALVQVVDAVSTGKQPAPTDIGITWDSNHFVRGADGSTYIPFTLSVDPAQMARPEAAVYVRVVNQDVAAAPAEQGNNNREQAEPTVFPWDNVYFMTVGAEGDVSRAMALKPGNYEVFVAIKEQSPLEPQRNQPPAKVGLLRRSLTVPDFGGTELSTSSVIIASLIEPVTTPLTPEQQQENPYTFGTMRVVPSDDVRLSKSEELQVLFWIYGTQQTNGKPDVEVEYNFHQRTTEGEKYFNKTAPQALNAQTLPPQFDIAAGHQLPGSLVVPLASFPEGDYRLEIKITDKLSGRTLTENAMFTVVS
jgi:hypothetical protein